MQDNYRFSNKIDISEYDIITLSGLKKNGSEMSNSSNRFPTISIYINGELVNSGDFYNP